MHPTKPSTPPPSPSYQPNAKETLYDRAPSPYSLREFDSFVRSQHCSEILYFTQAICGYRTAYTALADGSAEHARPQAVRALWREIIYRFISTTGIEQVNLNGRVREAILAQDLALGPDSPPPNPEVLREAEASMHELIYDVFQQFVDRAASKRFSDNSAMYSGWRNPAGSITPPEGSIDSFRQRSQSRAGPFSMTQEEFDKATSLCEEHMRLPARPWDQLRTASDPEGLPSMSYRRAHDILGTRVYRNITLCRSFASKTAKLVRISSSDKVSRSDQEKGRTWSVSTTNSRPSSTSSEHTDPSKLSIDGMDSEGRPSTEPRRKFFGHH